MFFVLICCYSIHVTTFIGPHLLCVGFVAVMPFFSFLKNFKFISRCYESMLLQHEESMHNRSNLNLTNYNKLNNYVADLSMGINVFAAKMFIFTLVMHLFDIYILKHFTLVNPYIVISSICG